VEKLGVKNVTFVRVELMEREGVTGVSLGELG